MLYVCVPCKAAIAQPGWLADCASANRATDKWLVTDRPWTSVVGRFGGAGFHDILAFCAALAALAGPGQHHPLTV